MWPNFLGRKVTAADPERWLVLDVESSGLDASTDRLRALAAVAVRHDRRRARIDLADGFQTVLPQPADAGPLDKSNILVLGIGVAAQGRGIDPAAALGRFEAFIGASPLPGFHVEFDRRMLDFAQRHQAAADTLATAELLLHLWPGARAEGVADFQVLSRLAARRRWLS